MKKKLLSLLLALLLAVGLSAPAFAEELTFVFDDCGELGDVREAEAYARQVYEQTGVYIGFCVTDNSGGSAAEYAEALYDSSIDLPDGIMLVHDVALGRIGYCSYGQVTRSVPEEMLDKAITAYDQAETYGEGITAYIAVMSYAISTAEPREITPLEPLSPAPAGDGIVTPEENPLIPIEHRKALVVDEAGVLTAGELSSLNATAESITDRWGCDVAVVFIFTLNGRDVAAVADDYYDYNGYGYGDNDDGILLLVSVGDRKYATSTYGYGIYAFTDYGLEMLENAFIPPLRESDWAGAAESFLSESDSLLNRAHNQAPVDINTPMPRQPMSTPKRLGIALLIGLVLAGIPMLIMKSQLKSVRRKDSAEDYTRPGSFRLQYSRDQLLNSHVTRTRRETETRSSGGGSNTHFSSSGRSHGGHSGSF